MHDFEVVWHILQIPQIDKSYATLISRCILSDTCYVLSFAVIMLNTSLHNPSVKDKPTVDRFVAMNRGINEGGDLPRELLEVCGILLDYLVT